jgi:hypothetical protein
MSAARGGGRIHYVEPDGFSKSMRLLMSKEIVDTYPGKWVAIYDGKVVGSSTDPDDLMSNLRLSDIPVEEAAIKYIHEGPVVFY